MGHQGETLPEKKPAKKAPAKKKAAAKKAPAKKVSKATAEARKHAEEERQAAAEQEEKDRWSTWDKRVRDSFIFLLGAAAFVNEIFFTDSPRPAALVAIGGMIGIPLVLAADEKRREGP
jgi:hypothetical protein